MGMKTCTRVGACLCTCAGKEGGREDRWRLRMKSDTCLRAIIWVTCGCEFVSMSNRLLYLYFSTERKFGNRTKRTLAKISRALSRLAYAAAASMLDSLPVALAPVLL